MNTPPHLSCSEPTCRLSDPALLHKVCHRTDPPLTQCYACKEEQVEWEIGHYYCATCNLEFHLHCFYAVPEIRHPFHLSHPLTLISSSSYNDDDDFYDDDDDAKVSPLVGTYNSCKCCRKPLEDRYYHCSICNFFFNIECLVCIPPLTISHQKRHEHTLTSFPRRLPLPCDACGESLEDKEDVVYSCLPCNYMVHSKCIYLPRVIKITRHQRRLSYTSSLSPADFPCRVCRKTVDINCGQYSCSKGCHYAVHSKCATRYDVWDGKDLEGVPEEPEDDIEPFVRIDEETILHFTHEQHHLKLHKNINIYGETKFCEACCLAIPSSKAFYSCMECDFILDEECASLPRKKHHPLHKHPLILYPFLPPGYPLQPFYDRSAKGIAMCDGCLEITCGFTYLCFEEGCKFKLDVRCASLPDPLIHGCHPQDHPLFFNLTKGECMGCKSTQCSDYDLECMQCNSFLGLKCAPLPSLAYYKHDQHPLTLHYGEKGTTKEEYWCEICESKLDTEKWFYTCQLCSVTVHVKCLLGQRVYMKPNHILKIDGFEDIEIGSNDGNTRPLCSRCHKRCQNTLIFFKGEDGTLCSWLCLVDFLLS